MYGIIYPSERNNVTAISSYTWNDKSKAVQLYMLNGNMRLVSEVTSIPYDTLCDWKKQDWWATVVEELRTAVKAKRGTRMSNIIDTSLEIVQDRLEKGDWIFNQKTGQLVRKPVALKDAAQVTNNLIDRQLQMEEMADRMNTNKTTVQETLTLLAKEFQKLNRSKQKAEATEVVFTEIKETTDALYD